MLKFTLLDGENIPNSDFNTIIRLLSYTLGFKVSIKTVTEYLYHSGRPAYVTLKNLTIYPKSGHFGLFFNRAVYSYLFAPLEGGGSNRKKYYPIREGKKYSGINFTIYYNFSG